MSPENAEKLGVLADRLDAVLYSAKLPIPASIHVTAMTEIIRESRDICSAIVREETGEDPWETNPWVG